MKKLFLLFCAIPHFLHTIPIELPEEFKEMQNAFHDYIRDGLHAKNLSARITYLDMYNHLSTPKINILKNLRFKKQFNRAYKWLETIKSTSDYNETLNEAMEKTVIYNPFYSDNSQEMKQLARAAWDHFDACASKTILQIVFGKMASEEPVFQVELYRTAIIAKFLLIYQQNKILQEKATFFLQNQ